MRLLLLSAVSICLPLAAQTGRMNVSVKDGSGANVLGASVKISARPVYGGPQSKPGPLTYNVSGKSGVDGVFSTANVPPGAYAICADLPGSLLVDSCAWSDSPSTVFVRAGETVAAAILLQRGTRVTVQVNDATHLLQSEAFPGHKLRLVVGTAGGQRVPMAISQMTAAARQFSLVVPVDTDLRLQIRSETIQVAGSNGVKVDMKDYKAFVPLRIPADAAAASAASASTSPQFRFDLIGLL